MKLNLDHKDKRALAFAFVCAIFIAVVLTVLGILNILSFEWLLLPGSWLIGALMTWAVGKFTRSEPLVTKA